MPKIDNRFDELKAFTRDVFSNAAPTDLTGGDILTNLVGREVILYPDVDVEAFAAKFGKRAGAVRAVLETLKGMQHPEVDLASPEAQTSEWVPPPCPVTPSAPPMEAPRQLVPGSELLCTASGRLPKHAMLGNDGRLYDRASIAKTPMARHASDDLIMTAAVAAWREYADDPARLLANLRAVVMCPITLAVPKEPVLAADGFSYERADILLHFQTRGEKACSPRTNEPLKHQRLVPNTNLTRLIAAQGLAEPDAVPASENPEQRYCTHPRLGAEQIIVADAAHRRAFDTARLCLDQLYAWAPTTLFNKHATGQIAAKACEHLTCVLQSKPPQDVRRAALQMRAEVYCLTEAWPEASADLDQLTHMATMFELTRRALLLQATGRSADARTCVKRAMSQGLSGDLRQNPELLAVLGEFLRHEHRYQLAHHHLRESQKQAPTTAAARSLSKTRISMLKRMMIPKQLSEAECAAALAAGVDA